MVKLIAEGHTSREIGEILSISVNTVERHRHNVLEKLNLRDRVDLTRYERQRLSPRSVDIPVRATPVTPT